MQKLSRLLNKSLKYLTAATILAVPLYPKFPFITVPGTFVSIRTEDFLIGLLAVNWFILVFPNIGKLLKDRLTRAILLYLAIGFISLLSAIFLTKTVSPSIGVLHWVRRIEYFIPFFVGSYVISKDRSSLQFYFKLLLIVVFMAFVYGFGQKYFTWPVIITQNAQYAKGIALRWIEGSHISSTFAGHYDLATFLVLILPMFATSFFILKGKATRVILGAAFVLGLWLMANAVSRISIAAYMGSVTLALILVKKYKAIALVMVISIALFATSSTIITRYNRIFEVVRTRIEAQIDKVSLNFNSIIYAAEAEVITPPPDPKIIDQQASPQPEDRSSSIRINVEWPRAIRALSKNPLLGTGFSSITLATDNDYLRLLGEVGILGFLSFSLIFIRLGELILKRFPLMKNFSGIELAFISSVVASLPGLFLNAVFIDIFEASKFAILFWLLIGFLVALLRDEKANNITKG